MPERPEIEQEKAVDRRQFHNAWARNGRDNKNSTTAMTEKLKAMLSPRRT